MLDLKLLATFREVAVRGSFSEAAAALGYTQPAVSQHVARLEKALDTRLLEREPRGVRLTTPGEVLLEHAAALLERARLADEAVRSAAGAGRARVRVGAFPSAAAGLVPDATRELRRRRPDAQVDLRVLEPDKAVEELLAGRIDVAALTASDLVGGPLPPALEELPVCEDPLLITLAADHPLAARSAIALDELAGEPWLLTTSAGGCLDESIVRHACRRAGFDPDVRLSSAEYPVLQGMAAAGVGVALIPTLAAGTMRRDVVVRPVRGTPPVRRIVAAVRMGERDPLVDHVIEALRAAARTVLAAGTPLAVAA